MNMNAGPHSLLTLLGKPECSDWIAGVVLAAIFLVSQCIPNPQPQAVNDLRISQNEQRGSSQ